MTRFIKTVEGFVHSVVDDYRLFEGQTEATKAEADAALLGKGGGTKTEQPTVIAAAAVSDDIHTQGAVDPRKLDVTAFVAPTVFPDGKPEVYPNGTDPVANATSVGDTTPTTTSVATEVPAAQPADEGGPVDDHGEANA